jgi:hypothetical protein
MKKLSLWLSGVGVAVVGLASGVLAHAQSFALATSTENTNNGAFLQTAYDRIINLLSSTGAVLFMIVIAILGVVVWLAVKTPRHVVNS